MTKDPQRKKHSKFKIISLLIISFVILVGLCVICSRLSSCYNPSSSSRRNTPSTEALIAREQRERRELLDSIHRADSIQYYDSLKLADPDSYQTLVVADSLRIIEAYKLDSLRQFAIDDRGESWEVIASENIKGMNARGDSVLVSSFKFVYVRSDLISDATFLKLIINKIYRSKTTWVKILFFDNRYYTPSSYPMTSTQENHLKAQYLYNPGNNHEAFDLY